MQRIWDSGDGMGCLAVRDVRRKRGSMRGLRTSGRVPAESLEPRLLLSRDLYVDIASPGPVHDGSSWVTAYADLQLALAAANTGDRLLIADGTYKPTTTTDRSISFTLEEGVSLLGGYAGYGAANPDARDVSLYPTILSGDIGSVGDNSDNSYHVISSSDITSATSLDGLTVTAGNASGDPQAGTALDFGGGMYVWASALSLSNCTFTGNAAGSVGWGGGMYIAAQPSPTLANCGFTGNSANYGGGLWNASASTLTSCSFSGNTANWGGGTYDESSAAFINCTFRGNSGTGAYLRGAETLSHCSFTGNLGAGASIAGSATISNSTFIGNANSGAGISGSPLLTNCIFVGNWAGGALPDNGGGGIYNTGSPTLTNCTFVANAARTYGGAVYNQGSPVLTNCIIAACGNTPFYSYHVGAPTVSYSIVQGGYSGAGTADMDADPMFVRSPWAGPDGQFGTADDDLGDLRLRSGSPALNSGYNQAVPAGVTTDLAGNPRIQGGTVDRGAYEGANPAPAAKTLYVDASATGTNTGGSWTNAFRGLQSALAAASDGDTIRVADGTYKPTTTTDRTCTFALRNNVSVYGGYAGCGAANPDARDARLYSSILSGDLGVAGDKSDNSNHVVVGIGLTASAVLDGLTITAGYGPYWDAPDGHALAGYGGGMVSLASFPTLNNCTFLGNSAISGGGMAILGTSAPTLTNCSFTANTAYWPSPSSNGIAGNGGGIYTWVSSPSLSNCSFIRNSTGPDGDGGGMYNVSFRTTFPASPVLVNVSFLGNTAKRGGGMCNISSEPSVADGLFVGNSAEQGGGVYNETYYGTFSNCTFAGNVAATAGAIYTTSYVPPTLINGIIWGNGASPLYTENSTLTLSRCDIQGGGTSGGNLDLDPQFVRTPSAGADGTWGTEDDDYGNLRLRYTSPCIDAGSTGSGLSRITDLAGNTRFVDVPSVPDTGFGQTPLIDLGVYEMPATPDTTHPAITSVSINDGAIQRSMVKKVAVSFSEPMSLVPGALTVKLSSGLAVPNTTITLANPSDDQRSFVLTFSGPGAVGGSLADGIYNLIISSAGVQDLGGNALTADYSQRFHRLFGDVDGNRVVNALDYAKLKATYGRSSADPLFNSAFDYEGNGVINALDLAQFRKRYGLLYSY